MRKIFTEKLYFFLIGVLMGSHSSPSKRNEKMPNFIIILADDLGYGSLACFGDFSLPTPNIDELARKNIRFTDFHSNASVCTPTQAALLTRNYQQRAGLEGVIYVWGARWTIENQINNPLMVIRNVG